MADETTRFLQSMKNVWPGAFEGRIADFGQTAAPLGFFRPTEYKTLKALKDLAALPEGQFDMSVALGFDGATKALQGLVRILKPGGSLLVTVRGGSLADVANTVLSTARFQAFHLEDRHDLGEIRLFGFGKIEMVPAKRAKAPSKSRKPRSRKP